MEAGYKQITHGTYNMHKITNITIKAFAAMLMLAAAASCVFEKENPSGNGQQKYKYVLVQLGVSTDRMTPTKADGDVTGADDEAGSTAETAIRDLRVYAYTNDGENGAKVLRGYFHAQDVDAAATATKPLLMDIKVPFEEYGTTKQVHFMAVANAGGMTGTDGIIISSIGRDPQTGALVLPETFGFGEFADIRYSVADQTFADGMPMYCQTSAAVEVNLGATQGTTTSTEPGHNGHTKLPVQVTLDMTRSLAKIEVYAAESASATTGKDGTATTSVTITGVSLANVPQSGNLFTAPTANATLTYTDFNGESGGTGYSTSFLKDEADIVTVNKKVSETATADIQNPDNYTLVSNAYYLAENNQGSTRKENGKDIDVYEYGSDAYPVVGENGVTAAATVLKIDYKVGGTEKTGYVKMPQIKRNTWYKVLARITAGGQMTLTFVVQPWNLIEEAWDFTDQISVDKRFEWTGGTRETDAELGKEIISTKTANLTCSFSIATPTYATWKAEFIPVSGDPKAFKFVTQNGLEDSVTGTVGTAASLTIQPRVTNVNQENEVKLRITVITKDGLTIFAKALMPENAVADEFTIIQSY